MVNTPKPVLPGQNGNLALFGTPMWDYLLQNIFEEWRRKQMDHTDRIEMTDQEIEERLYYLDPEIQVICVICPNCSSADTIRTTEPDEDNVSEFECMNSECKQAFVAINPSGLEKSDDSSPGIQ